MQLDRSGRTYADGALATFLESVVGVSCDDITLADGRVADDDHYRYQRRTYR